MSEASRKEGGIRIASILPEVLSALRSCRLPRLSLLGPGICSAPSLWSLHQHSLTCECLSLRDSRYSPVAEAQYDTSSRRRWVSKAASGELADKKALLDHLAGEIEEVKRLQKQQYMNGYRGGNTRMQAMADAPLFSSPEREQLSR